MNRLVPALAVLGLVLAPATAADAHSTPQAHVWVTSPDGTAKLSDQGTVPLTSATPPAAGRPVTVTIDDSRTSQTMTGYGASITDSSAHVLYGLSPAVRDATMRDLFDPVHGDGLDFLRQPVGASDFVTADYTFDDLPPGQTDYAQQHFSIEHDEAQILPLLRRARQINPHVTIMATPWSPPAWMKTSGSLVGGRLIDDPRIYQSYALYLVKFLQAYRDRGVPVDLISVQNEPQNRTPSGYPGTDLSAAQEIKVIEALGPLLRRAGLRTQILGYDHNWLEHPGDVANTPPDETQDTDQYPQEILSSPAAKWVAGTAYHCYYADPSAQTALHRQFPTKDIYFTECSGTQSSDPADTFSDTLKFDARTLEIGTTRNWAKSVVNWNLALDPAGGPHVGGCGTCTGVITVGPGDTVTRNAEYYALGHLARFVKPGAVHVASTSFGTTGWNGQIMDVAFINPDGSHVLVAHNENDNPQAFTAVDNGRQFTYTLPGGSIATFVWRGDAHHAAPAIDPARWRATANPAAPADPCCTGDVAANAVDDDAATRWSTGTAQAAGQYLQVDLGRIEPVGRFVLDAGAGTGDYPRGYTVTTSRDGVHWSAAVTDGTGTGQLTTVNLGGAPVRFVRVTLTAASGSWWSVADTRAYRTQS
jgi:glucosylceramidase